MKIAPILFLISLYLFGANGCKCCGRPAVVNKCEGSNNTQNNFIEHCICDGVLSVNWQNCDPQPGDWIGIFKCNDYGGNVFDYQAETWLWTCGDDKCSDYGALETGGVTFSDPPPAYTQSGPHVWPLPTCTCLVAVLNREDGLSPPPYGLIIAGTEFIIPDARCNADETGTTTGPTTYPTPVPAKPAPNSLPTPVPATPAPTLLPTLAPTTPGPTLPPTPGPTTTSPTPVPATSGPTSFPTSPLTPGPTSLPAPVPKTSPAPAPASVPAEAKPTYQLTASPSTGIDFASTTPEPSMIQKAEPTVSADQQPACTGVGKDAYAYFGNGSFIPCCDSAEQCHADWNGNTRCYVRCVQMGTCFPADPDLPIEKPPATCTAVNQDPYKINGDGTFTPCCNPSQQCLANWNDDGRYYYRCIENDVCPTIPSSPDQPPLQPPAIPEQCTGINEDPYELFGNGTFIPCCIPDSQCLSDWNSNERCYYRCVEAGTCPPADPNHPLTPEVPPATCTAVDQDPYEVNGDGTFIPCCNPSDQCLRDWDGDGRNYYRCASDCSPPAGTSAPTDDVSADTPTDGQQPACTGIGEDAYAFFGNGSFIPCCDSTEQCHADWNGNTHCYIRCVAVGACPPENPDYPLTPEEPPATCTGLDQDPYEVNGDGTFIPCCNPSQQCLADWNSNGRFYYRCVDYNMCPTIPSSPDQPPLQPPAIPEQCTGINEDPYELFGNGTFIPCCIPDSQCLSDWNSNERCYYRCVEAGTCPLADPNHPLTPEVPPATCTAVNQDPYEANSDGTFIPCCNPGDQCLKDWDGDGRNYYRCASDCVPTTPKCTYEDQDPFEYFGDGTEITCCSGLGKCLDDWNENDRFYYRCLECCGETCSATQLPSPSSTRKGVPTSELSNYVPLQGAYGVFVSKDAVQTVYTSGTFGRASSRIVIGILFTGILSFSL
jgi:hypothetical protein